jgi:hypothetical protein
MSNSNNDIMNPDQALLSRLLSFGKQPSTGNTPSILDSILNKVGGIDWFDKTENGIKNQGALAPMLGVAQGLGNAFLGMKQYGLAKDTFNENKRQFNLNYDAQRKTINTDLEDRQRARVASNPGAYQSVGDYMKQNGV